MGFVHYNLSAEDQVEFVRAVKRHPLGCATDVHVLGPNATFADLRASSRTYAIVTSTGRLGGRYLGIAHARTSDGWDAATLASKALTSALGPEVAPASTSAAAEAALAANGGVDAVAVVQGGELVGAQTREFLSLRATVPARGEPSTDGKGRLLCGAAAGTREGDKARIAALVEAGVD